MGIFIIVLICLYSYLALSLCNRIEKTNWFASKKNPNKKNILFVRIFVLLTALVLFIFQFIVLASKRLPQLDFFYTPEFASYFYILKFIAYCLIGVFGLLIFVLLAIDLYEAIKRIISFIVKLIFKSDKNKTDKTNEQINFNRRAVITTSAFVGINCIWAIPKAIQIPNITNVNLPIKNLPEAFNGFTIAQISDLHIGDLLEKSFVEKVVELTNNLKPDLIALTGDVVDGYTSSINSMTEPLKYLESKNGIFLVSGNHEYYSGWESWQKQFIKYGFTILSNQNQIIEKSGQQIAICGVTDLSTRSRSFSASIYKNAIISNPVKAKSGLSDDMVKILLAHQPGDYDLAANLKYDLMLSGHTHGGQMFPFNFLVKLVHRYYKGLYLHDQMWIYVNKGTGYWGPPMRSLSNNEISLITLEKG